MPDPAWSNIIRLQQEVKRLTTLAEENQLHSMEFIQPILEQRSALEHICRAKAAEVGISKRASDREYIQKQYDKAMGHLYRAFFDVADWLGLTVKEKILDLVTPYDAEVIHDVMPEYYRDIRPRIESLVQEIAHIRSDKDIGQSSSSLIKQVGDYGDRVREIADMYAKLFPKIPALAECQAKCAQAKARGAKLKIVEIILTVILTAIVTWLFTRSDNSSSKSPPITTTPLSLPAVSK